MNQREARRQRNREDAQRIRQMQVLEHPSHVKSLNKMGIPLTDVGAYAGNTFREHLEDEIRKAMRVWRRLNDQAANAPQGTDLWGEQGIEQKRKAARGVVRGLCKALLIYEDSYNKDDAAALKRLEKEFLDG